MFEAQVVSRPDAVALEFDSVRLTYRELNARANRLARHLRGRGVGTEVPVGICLARSLEMIVAVLGVLKAGGAYVALDPQLPAERVQVIVEDTAMPLVVSESALATAGFGQAQVVRMDADETGWAGNPDTNPDQSPQLHDLAYVIYTSGSTGRPKGVMVEHRAAVNLLVSIQREPGFTASDTLLAVTPLFFDVSVAELFLPLVSGGRLVLASREETTDGVQIRRLIENCGVTFFTPTPSTWRLLLAAGWAGTPGLKMISTGESFPRELAVALLNKGAELWNLYGPTETTIWSLGTRVIRTDTPISIGRPLANTEAWIVDSALKPVGPAAEGELLIGGLGLARGYLNRTELTAEKFIPHPRETGMRLYRTGDLARWLPDGSIECLGRLDQQVKLRGYRIELGEIEAALERHSVIGQAVAAVRDVAAGDARLVAYFTWAGTSRATAAELRTHLRAVLPGYMIPGSLVALAVIPLTPSGKVDRRALDSSNWDTLALAELDEPANSETERWLAAMWQEVLSLPQLPGRNLNFFDLGGHSLAAMRVVQQLQSRCQCGAPIRLLFDHPTIAGLAAWLRERDNLPASGLVGEVMAGLAGTDCPLSFAQQRIWFHERYAPGLPAYNIPLQLRLHGPLDPVAVAVALNGIVRRHATLRTAVVTGEHEPWQVVRTAVPVAVPVTDLGALSESDREAAAQREALVEARKIFDLSQGRLLRARLFRLSEHEHLLVITVHHLAADGWSLAILWEEFAGLYEAHVRKAPDPLPPLRVQYVDYSVWQRRELDECRAEQALMYWRQQLAGCPTLSSLPGKRVPADEGFFEGGRVCLHIGADTARALERLAAERQVTPFMLLLASLQALVHRYSGQTDFAIGTPVAERGRIETAGMIGCLVNLLALRTDLGGDPTFTELLGRVRATVLGALAHQDLPFERLVESLKLSRMPGQHPLFQILFNYQDVPLPRREFGGLTAEAEEFGTGFALFDLMLIVTPEPPNGGLEAVMEFNTGLYALDTVRRLLESWAQLLTGISKHPEKNLSKIPLLVEEERVRLLGDWAGRRSPYPRDRRVHELFSEQAAMNPSAPAVVTGTQLLTYQELDESSGRLANHLRAQGVGIGTPVAILAERSPEFIVALLAVLKAGGIYVPIDPEYPAERIRLLLTDSTAPVVVRFGLVPLLTEQPATVVDLRRDAAEIARQPSTVPPAAISAESGAALFYTSGSTGGPKGVCIPHRAMVRLVRDTNYAEFAATDVFLQLAPVSFDAATLEIWGCLLNGARLVLPPPGLLSLAGIGALLDRYQVSVLWLSAGLFRLMVDKQLAALARVRHVLAGGDVLSPDHVRRLLAAGCRGVTNGYGPTENTTFTACHSMTEPPSPDEPVPLGRPVANTEVYVLDESLQPVPVGVVGEFYAGGDGLAIGYWRQPELTAARFIPHPFHAESRSRLYRTGDLGCWRPDGLLEFRGRRDLQAKIRGFRVEPEEVERVLQQHPQIQEAVVVVRVSGDGEKQLVAYGQTVPGTPATPADWHEFLSSRLPDYMVPVTFVALAQLPLTPHGKVDRAALLAEKPVNIVSSMADERPATLIEAVLLDLWCRLLGVERIHLDENFFDLGGHSLLSLRLLDQVRDSLGVELPPRLFFADPTIRGFARQVLAERMRHPDGVTFPIDQPMVAIQAEGQRPPIFVFPGGYGDESELISHAWLSHRYLGKEQPIYALKNRAWRGAGKLRRNLAELAQDCLTDMRRVQPRGPWFLVGLCVGGNLAFEVARQLQEADEAVPLLMLSDCERPRAKEYLRLCLEDPFRGKRQFVMNTLYLAFPRLRPLLNAAGRRRLFGALSMTDDQRRDSAKTEQEWRFYQDGEGYLRRQMVAPQGQFRGRMHLVLSEELSADARARSWQQHATEGAEVLVLPGSHATYQIEGAQRLADFYRHHVDPYLAARKQY